MGNLALVANSIEISNGGRQALPARLKVLNWGPNPSIGKISPVVGTRTVEELPRNQAAAGLDRVPIDYEHTSGPRGGDEPRKVAGYGVPQVVPGEGLFLDHIVWTPSGEEYAREYIDLSPSLSFAPGTPQVSMLHAVALTRAGAVRGLHFYSVSEQTNPGTHDMTPEEITAAIDAALAPILARIEQLEKATPAPDPQMAELSAQVQNFGAELARRDKQALLADAARDGKVVNLAVTAVEALSVTDLAAHIATLTPTVPLRPSTRPNTPPADGASLLAQFNAIDDPDRKREFYKAHRTHMFGGK